MTRLPLSFTRAALALTLAAVLGACATTGGDAPARASDGVLVGAANGMTLYTFDRDAAGSGKSMCNGPCATNWPPLMAASGAAASGDWSIVTRDDGSRQWAYKGKPVYFWAKDTKPGDRTGDGFNKVWQLARP
jgi:predicted lipoprotein with Yx(FWY)xxD motif